LFAQRISYVGELGWELYGPFEMGQRLWDAVWEAGRGHGLTGAGLGAFDSLRFEKGYRLWGQDLSIEHDPFAAGIGFAVRMEKPDFNGKVALQRVVEEGPLELLSCLTFDDPSTVVMGKEPVWADGRMVSYLTSAN